mmetsp:Transcript_16316/g.31039  ORF Transcript_16316/g.31039 Transcript_16316/m.31039 type:complete len:138 (+) Transcript_16316:110-523(+)|eukprot:scaffold569_cov165-Amphora_coffeaeformis.AAC.10
MSEPTTPATPVNTDGNNNYDDHHEDEEVHEEEVNEVQDWDEGGPSHCGYAETVHETIMAVGKSVHTVVGDPSPSVEHGVIKSVGNWFQEASYAVRDFVRGNKEVEDDASQTFNDMKESAMSAIYGDKEEENQHPTQQ